MNPTPPELERTAVADGDWLPGYDVRGLIGSGGFGTVYRARQLKLDREVAVKVVRLDRADDPALAVRFEAEAVALARFSHPHIVQVYDYGHHGGRVYLAMELLEGEDLGQRLRRAGPLDERTAWAIARQAASALAHAAERGVVHRDVKPANIFLTDAPVGAGLPAGVPLVKVADFGLARVRWADGPPADRQTADGAILGTPVYMAPEQYRGAAGVDHRADIYALGATVCHALTGRPPFSGKSIWEVIARKQEHRPDLGPVSPESAALLAAMLAPDRADRIATYAELIERIDRLPAMRDEPAPAPRRSAWRRCWRTAAAIAVLAVAVGIGAAVAGRGGSPARRTAAPAGAAVRYVSDGEHTSLFDGVKTWMPPLAGGAWAPEEDDEGGTVLEGTGFARRTFADHADYRVTIGLDLHEAAAAEVHFGLAARAPDTSPRLVLRVSRAGGAVLGRRDADRAPFRPIGEPVPFPSPEWLKGHGRYLEVRFERAGGTWAVWFNRAEAGRVEDDGTAKAAELRLRVEGGPARVDSAVLERLVPSPE